MGTGLIEKKFEILPDNLKLKVEGYIDALLNENGISIRDLSVSANKKSDELFVVKPGFGGGKGIFGYMADDFDEPLDDFKDYM
ncbi:DUF2281 domain-containing protein [Mucilaginibacter sp. UC70_90]